MGPRRGSALHRAASAPNFALPAPPPPKKIRRERRVPRRARLSPAVRTWQPPPPPPGASRPSPSRQARRGEVTGWSRAAVQKGAAVPRAGAGRAGPPAHCSVRSLAAGSPMSRLPAAGAAGARLCAARGCSAETHLKPAGAGVSRGKALGSRRSRGCEGGTPACGGVRPRCRSKHGLGGSVSWGRFL